MVLSGEIPSVSIGNRKRLINYDLLLAQLNNLSVAEPQTPQFNFIRKVAER